MMRASRVAVLALAIAGCLLLGGSTQLHAAGTVSVTPTFLGNGVTQYKVVWTSDAAGAVSGNAFGVTLGYILSVKFVPDSGGTQPTDLYDATLLDSDGIDVLNAQAANLSNATGRYFTFEPRFFFPGATGLQTLDLVIANAGNAKGGIVYVWVQN